MTRNEIKAEMRKLLDDGMKIGDARDALFGEVIAAGMADREISRISTEGRKEIAADLGISFERFLREEEIKARQEVFAENIEAEKSRPAVEAMYRRLDREMDDE